jgi:hypothetical protein
VKLPRVSAALGRCYLRRGADLPQVGRLPPPVDRGTRWTIASFLGAGGLVSAMITARGEAMKQPVERRLAAILGAISRENEKILDCALEAFLRASVITSGSSSSGAELLLLLDDGRP